LQGAGVDPAADLGIVVVGHVVVERAFLGLGGGGVDGKGIRGEGAGAVDDLGRLVLGVLRRAPEGVGGARTLQVVGLRRWRRGRGGGASGLNPPGKCPRGGATVDVAAVFAIHGNDAVVNGPAVGGLLAVSAEVASGLVGAGQGLHGCLGSHHFGPFDRAGLGVQRVGPGGRDVAGGGVRLQGGVGPGSRIGLCGSARRPGDGRGTGEAEGSQAEGN